MLDTPELEKVIGQLLDDFYTRRIDTITKLQLQDALKHKNPYLYLVVGVTQAAEIVEDILSAYNEGIFGDAFFEPLTRIETDTGPIIRLMKDKSQKHLPAYQQAYDAAVNRFTRDFITEFCNEDGTINWGKLIHFSSGPR